MIRLADATQAQEKKATRAAYGKTLAELYEQGLPIVAVDADLSGSTTTKAFAQAGQEESKRLFNVGIAEQNMIDVAAGLRLRAILLLPVRSRSSARDVAMTRSVIRSLMPTLM